MVRFLDSSSQASLSCVGTLYARHVLAPPALWEYGQEETAGAVLDHRLLDVIAHQRMVKTGYRGALLLHQKLLRERNNEIRDLLAVKIAHCELQAAHEDLQAQTTVGYVRMEQLQQYRAHTQKLQEALNETRTKNGLLMRSSDALVDLLMRHSIQIPREFSGVGVHTPHRPLPEAETESVAMRAARARGAVRGLPERPGSSMAEEDKSRRQQRRERQVKRSIRVHRRRREQRQAKAKRAEAEAREVTNTGGVGTTPTERCVQARRAEESISL